MPNFDAIAKLITEKWELLAAIAVLGAKFARDWRHPHGA